MNRAICWIGWTALALSGCHGGISPADVGPNDTGTGTADSGRTGSNPDTGPLDTGVGTLVLQKHGGDGQSGVAGTALPSPLSVGVFDLAGKPATGRAVAWTISSGMLGSPSTLAGPDGNATNTVTLPMTPGTATVTAALEGAIGSPISFVVRATGGLVYIDPPAGGKVRLVLDPSASSPSPTSISLQLVAAQPAAAFSVGFNLPIDAAKVRLAGDGMIPGTALFAGTNPAAAKAMIPRTGPLKDQLVSAQSQKASGNGAAPMDASIAAGAVFYTLHLEAVPGATPGVIFDGTALRAPLSAGLRNKAGSDVAGSMDFAIGRLELR